MGRHKVILLGEHSVVHGHPALGAPLGEAMAVDVSEDPAGASPIVEGIPGHPEVIEAVRRMARKEGWTGGGPRVRATIRLPAGAGLGGSAAFCVGFARAALAALGRPDRTEEVLAIAGRGEGVFHGNPSGIDAWLASSRIPALFRRGQPPRGVPPGADLHLVVLVDRERTATSAMVAGVRSRLERDPAGTRAVFREIEDLVRDGTSAVERGRPDVLGPLLTHNHDLLVHLGVSSDGLDALAGAARNAGALGAKMTGGGGGGAVIALCEDEAASRRVLDRAGDRAARAFATCISIEESTP